MWLLILVHWRLKQYLRWACVWTKLLDCVFSLTSFILILQWVKDCSHLRDIHLERFMILWFWHHQRILIKLESFLIYLALSKRKVWLKFIIKRRSWGNRVVIVRRLQIVFWRDFWFEQLCNWYLLLLRWFLLLTWLRLKLYCWLFRMLITLMQSASCRSNRHGLHLALIKLRKLFLFILNQIVNCSHCTVGPVSDVWLVNKS